MEKEELMKMGADFFISDVCKNLYNIDRIETLYKADPQDVKFKQFYNQVRKSFQLNEV